MNWPLRFVHLSIRYVGLLFTYAGLILCYLICSLRFVFLIPSVDISFHYVTMAAVYVGKARLRYVTTLYVMCMSSEFVITLCEFVITLCKF